MIPAPLYILAGGRSSRFGSDKALTRIDGQPLIVRLAEALAEVTDGVWAVADVPDKYAHVGIPTLADEQAHLGPIGGLARAMTHRLQDRGKGHLWLTACDWLDPAPSSLAPLADAIDASPDAAAAAYRDAQARWQPLPSLWHTRSLPAVREALRVERLAMWRLLEAVDALPVAFPAGHPQLKHANTPQELQGARR